MSPSRWPAIAAYALVGAATQVLWLTFAPVTTVAAVPIVLTLRGGIAALVNRALPQSG